MRSTMTMTAVAAVLVSASLVAGAPLRGGMVGIGGGDDGLRRVSEAFANAMRTGDAAGAAALFAEDGTDMPPGSAPLRGRRAIEAYYRALFAACRFTTFELSETESRAAGDVGYAAGVSRVAVGGAPAEAGKYLVVLRRAGAGWKVSYAIQNSDTPVAAHP